MERVDEAGRAIYYWQKTALSYEEEYMLVMKEVVGRLESMEDRLHSLEEALGAMSTSDIPSTRADHGSSVSDFMEEENLSEIPLYDTSDNDDEAVDVFSSGSEGDGSWAGLIRKTTSVGSLIVYTVKGNIAKLKIDVIVNAANRQLLAGAGVCAAIFEEAGDGLQEACDDLAPIKVGEAVITDAFQCRASYIAHAVGPRYREDVENSEKLLYNAYMNALKKADLVEARTIAFPSISSGIFGYPVREGGKVALRAIRDYKPKNLRVVVFCIIDEATCQVFDKLLAAESCYAYYGGV